jgi:hypothetical protein
MRPALSKTIGLAFGVAPLLLVYVTAGVVVPAAYVYKRPPAKGTPLLSKNCHPAPANGERLTVIVCPFDGAAK